MKLFLLEPEVVFQAQVNQASFTYPISQVTYDTAVGSFGDLERGLTILFGSASLGDDLGKAFVGPTEATADTLYFNLSSQGKREGEVSLSDNVHITVLNDYRVWPKTPDMPDGTVKYKWGTLEVGTNTTYTPPVANAGVPMAGEIDSGTGKLHAQFPPAATNSSFVTTEGATIAGYAWELPTGVTLSPGFALTDPVIEVDVDPGFYWLTLTVTDSNGKVHQARTFVLAIDPSDDPCITNIGSSTLRRSKETQTLSVEVFEDISKLDFPDGTLAIFIDGNPGTQDDRSNVLFWGWHQNDPGSVSSQREGFLTATTMTFVDVAGRLDMLPGFPQVIENEDIRDPEAHPSITWTHMVDPTLDKFIHYLLHWHSTALDLTDYIPSLTTTTYPIGGTLGSQGGSLWQQVTSRVKAFVPKRNIGCDKFGRLVVHMDPMTAPVAERTPLVQQHIGTDDMANIRWTSQTVPKYHWIRGSAIQSIDPLPLDENGDFTIPTFFCIAPGTAPGFGASEMSVGEQLAISQEDLNDATGHEYARQNAPFSVFDIELANPFSNTYYRHLDPVSMQWVTVTLEMQYAAQRGHALGVERGQLHEVVYEFRSQKEGTSRKTTLRWEKESIGDPAITVIMPDIPDTGDPYVPPEPAEPVALPEFGDPNLYYGTPTAYILWNPDHVFRTLDISVASPTWEIVSTGVTGQIWDGQYVQVAVDQVGMWLMTVDGIWWCDDIFATTPSWTKTLALATVQAADATPSSGAVGFMAMANYATEPGYLIVLTGPVGARPADYLHSYSWHTHDYGATWTQVDMPQYYTVDHSGNLSGYYGAGPYSVEIFRSAPGTIYAVRNTGSGAWRTDPSVFVSTDLGTTWVKRVSVYNGYNYPQWQSILHPYPSADDPSYVFSGAVGVTDRPDVFRSEDEWVTEVRVTDNNTLNPPGYGGVSGHQRANKKTFDGNHVMAWFRNNSENQWHLLDSDDRGGNWSLAYDPGINGYNVDSPQGSVESPPYNTPNGWPADELVWFLVRQGGGIGDGVILMTDDYFATTSNKEGNLAAVVGSTTWGTTGANINNGFALPKLGNNPTPDWSPPATTPVPDVVPAPIPYLALRYADGTQIGTETAWGPVTASSYVSVAAGEGELVGPEYGDELYINLIAPANVLYVWIEGTFSKDRDGEGTSWSATATVSEPNDGQAPSMTETFQSTTVPDSGSFEIVLGGSPWPANSMDLALYTSDPDHDAFPRQRVYTSAGVLNGTAEATAELTWTVTKVQLLDGTVYLAP